MVYHFKINVLFIVMLFLFTQCNKEDAYLILDVKEVRIGNLIDAKLKVDFSSVILDSTIYPNVYGDIRISQNVLKTPMMTFFDAYSDQIIILTDSVPRIFVNINGNIYLTTSLLKSIQTFDELSALFGHCYFHVQHHDITKEIIKKYGYENYDKAYFAKNISSLVGIEKLVTEAVFTTPEERLADDSCLSVLTRLETSKVLALSLINLNFSAGSNIGFFAMHPNYEGRIASLMQRSSPVLNNYTMKMEEYEIFLKQLP